MRGEAHFHVSLNLCFALTLLSFDPGRDIDDFLSESPGYHDKLIVHTTDGGQVKRNIADVLEQINNQIRIQIDFNTVEFVGK